ncbi:MAG: hypothetical protein HY906_12430 [Deltaproteobacteria bacterium]|nr:hypothetical protein [Deltaproteobacteria bacterium]
MTRIFVAVALASSLVLGCQSKKQAVPGKASPPGRPMDGMKASKVASAPPTAPAPPLPPEPAPRDDDEGLRKAEAKLAGDPIYARVLNEEWRDGIPSRDGALLLTCVSDFLANQRGNTSHVENEVFKQLKARKLVDALGSLFSYQLITGKYPPAFTRRVELYLAAALLRRTPHMGVWAVEEGGRPGWDFAALASWLQRGRPSVVLAAQYQRELLAARRAGLLWWKSCKESENPPPSRPYLTCEKEALERLAVLTKLTAKEQKRLTYLQGADYRAMPAAQQAFCDVVTGAAEEYEDAQRSEANELKLSKIRTSRRDGMVRVVPEGMAKDWVGVVRAMKTNSEGQAALSVRLPCGVKIATWNNALSDMRDRTLIPQSSKLFDVLADLGTGKRVKFDGGFISERLNGFKEESLTEQGSMADPVFIFRFSAVTKL